ncbi:hypothetical protein METP2_00795 [Methanosarcinales archaeon]|nr:glycosyltransferase family 39 protein [Candidatus Methanoperedens sp.]CAG0961103.1 hypothetical protein METP2_00795 [Methanosarcinales archaeon]
MRYISGNALRCAAKIIGKTDTTSILFLLFLIICGFLLRIYHLGAPSFWLDEAITANAAAALAAHGTPAFPSGFIYIRSILNTFFIALSFMIFDVSEFSARFPSVIFGTLMIPLVYRMGARLGNRKIALIAALFTTFSVIEIAWSRQARMYQQLQFFYLASIYFFYEFSSNDPAINIKNRRYLYLLLTILFFIGAVLSHEFGYVLILVFIPYFLIANFDVIKKRWKDYIAVKYFIGLVFFILFLVLFLKFMGSDFPHVISYVYENIWLQDDGYFEAYLKNLTAEFSVFFYLAIFGALLSIKKNWRSGLLLIMSFVIPFYIISFYVTLPGTRYLYFIFPIILIFSSYFFDFVIELAQKYGKNSSAKIGSTLIALVIISMLLMMAYSPQAFTILPEEKYYLGINAPQTDFKKAYSYVKENMQINDVVIDTWPAVSLFYMGRSDYWLKVEFFGIDRSIDSILVNNGQNEVYANSLVIKDLDMLKEMVAKHDRGWLVMDNTARILISSDIKEYIREELQIELSDENIRVYSWGMKI